LGAKACLELIVVAKYQGKIREQEHHPHDGREKYSYANDGLRSHGLKLQKLKYAAKNNQGGRNSGG
jgi:hypothetical protein